MVECVVFENGLGRLSSSKGKTKEEGGHVSLVQLLCAGQRGGRSRTNMPYRDIWCVSFVNLSKGRISDFIMTERIRQVGRGGEAL